MAPTYAALFICCLASVPFALAGEQPATAAGVARKLLGSPSMGMMGMSTSPMMGMSPMMMSPAMSPMMSPMMYNLTVVPSMEVPAVRFLSSLPGSYLFLHRAPCLRLATTSLVLFTFTRFCGCYRASS